MSTYFVAATGTDVGKTHVASLLCRQLRQRGQAVRALKPVLSGFDERAISSSDSGRLLDATGRAVSMEAIAAITPWRFSAPLSPDMAAAREGQSLNLNALVSFCQEEMEQSKETLIIEGVGGICVPLTDRETTLHWMRALHVPVFLVAGSYLGTISHTLSALDTLRTAQISVQAVIVSQSADEPVPLKETLTVLARHAGDVPIAAVPHIPEGPKQMDQCTDLTGLL